MTTKSSTLYKTIIWLFYIFVVSPCIGLQVWGAFNWHQGFFGWCARAGALFYGWWCLKAYLYGYLRFTLNASRGQKTLAGFISLIELLTLAVLAWGTCTWNEAAKAFLIDVFLLYIGSTCLTSLVKGVGGLARVKIPKLPV